MGKDPAGDKNNRFVILDLDTDSTAFTQLLEKVQLELATVEDDTTSKMIDSKREET